MPRPLVAKKKMDTKPKREQVKGAAAWSARVFAAHGRACYFCGGHATYPMHIYPRSMLGPKRWECPEENGRPGCRSCHDGPGANFRNFKAKDRHAAFNALNKVLTVKLKAA